MVTLAGGSGNHTFIAKHEGARRIVIAVVRVLVRDGLDGLSVRRVAAEAAVSIGAVQHHFPTKDALLVAAANHITSLFNSRAVELTDRVYVEQGPVAAFVAFCQLLANAAPDAETYPSDTDASVVWLWFAAKATQSGAVADAFTAGWSQTEIYLRDLMTDLFPHVDALIEAAHLLAVLDGLAVARAAEPERMPPVRAAAIVQRHIQHLQKPRI